MPRPARLPQNIKKAWLHDRFEPTQPGPFSQKSATGRLRPESEPDRLHDSVLVPDKRDGNASAAILSRRAVAAARTDTLAVPGRRSTGAAECVMPATGWIHRSLRLLLNWRFCCAWAKPVHASRSKKPVGHVLEDRQADSHSPGKDTMRGRRSMPGAGGGPPFSVSSNYLPARL